MMKEKQRKFYYLHAQNKDLAMQSAFITPFKDSIVPLLIVDSEFDEMIFK